MTSLAPNIDDPKLQTALNRLRRVQWVWAVLFALLGGLALATSGPTRPFLPLTWITIAAILAAGAQPIDLALVAVAWGLSLIFLIPGIARALNGDPVTQLFGNGFVELAASAVVRVLLLITAWNQFLLYRLLYGTQGAAGLDPALPPIPAVVPNPSDRVAGWARWIGFVGLMASIAAVPATEPSARINLLGAAFGCSVFAVGLGLGSAFVPTGRRGVALVGVGLGCLTLVTALLVARAFGVG